MNVLSSLVFPCTLLASHFPIMLIWNWIISLSLLCREFELFRNNKNKSLFMLKWQTREATFLVTLKQHNSSIICKRNIGLFLELKRASEYWQIHSLLNQLTFWSLYFILSQIFPLFNKKVSTKIIQNSSQFFFSNKSWWTNV